MGEKKDNKFLLLSHFRKNSRTSLTKISRSTNIPVSTIFDRLKAYENKLIKKHTILLDFAKLGYSARANALFQVDSCDKSDFKDYLLKSENVNSLYKINNGFDFFAELVFKNMKELEDFLDSLEEKYSLKQKVVFYVVEDLAREKFLTEPELAAL